MDYDLKFQEYLGLFNESLSKTLQSLDDKQPKILIDSIKYAIDGGGKRIRPILCFAVADMLNVDYKRVSRFAVAVEMIHSYSLVHDDLPAMDNDDYRRGKLSTHKKFGEAYGILAGDALLNLAFEICLDSDSFNDFDKKAMQILGEFAGYKGMISGQSLDLQNEKKSEINNELLYEIYEKKTSKLLTAPLLISSVFADGKYYDELSDFGYNLGIMFQITDDILDVEGDAKLLGKSLHKDEDEDKYTAVKLFGLRGAKQKAEYHYNLAKKSLLKIPKNEFLLKLLDKIYFRKG
ncbi:MAG: polyprenyl synthetase family protein [Clostridia bacterium]|nr:polyprenyl synthetase family protein [Clostridia bacterium]